MVTNSASGTVAILRGSGSGLLRRPVAYPAGSKPSEVALTDLNMDGGFDVVVANRIASGTVSVLVNNGTGTFGPATAYTAGDTPRSVAAADFDNDGFSDIIVANSGDSTVGILLGRGDGTLSR